MTFSLGCNLFTLRSTGVFTGGNLSVALRQRFVLYERRYLKERNVCWKKFLQNLFLQLRPPKTAYLICQHSLKLLLRRYIICQYREDIAIILFILATWQLIIYFAEFIFSKWGQNRKNKFRKHFSSAKISSRKNFFP